MYEPLKGRDEGIRVLQKTRVTAQLSDDSRAFALKIQTCDKPSVQSGIRFTPSVKVGRNK